MDLTCVIPANPDISGVGVRVAIYVQNFLSFIPAFWALSDGVVTLEELKTVEAQSMSILITAFSILISAIVQASTFGLSDFHSSIILSLSWMNNTNTFIYFLLYICYKSQPDCKEGVVAPRWRSWVDHISQRVSSRPSALDIESQPPRPLPNDDQRKGLIGRLSDTLQLFRKRIVLTLGSMHLTLMASFGIWLWASPWLFEETQEHRTNGKAFSPSENLPFGCTRTSLLGGDLSFASSALRYVSLIIYGCFLVPGLNLLFPTAFFLLMFLGVRIHLPSSIRSRLSRLTPFHVIQKMKRGLSYLTICFGRRPGKSSDQDHDEAVKDPKPNIKPIWAGLIVLFIVDAIFLFNIEVTIRRANLKRHQLQQPGESDWTFGQTLALLVLVLPIRDVIDYGAIQEQIRFERAKNSTGRLLDAVRAGDSRTAVEAARYADNICIPISDDCPSALFFAAWTGNLRLAQIIISRCIKSEIELRTVTEQKNNSGATPLCLAAFRGKLRVARHLLQHGANPNVNDNGWTPLMYAAWFGYGKIAQLLLENGADINLAPNGGPTPLICAARKRHILLVKLFLQYPVDVNQAEREGCTPLLYAIRNGDDISQEMVERLLHAGANTNQPHTLDKDWTPLLYAAREGHQEIVEFLLSFNADPNQAESNGQTALFHALDKDYKFMAERLIHRRPNINVADEDHRTPLTIAASHGDELIVQRLLDLHAQVDQADGDGWTPLMHAASHDYYMVAWVLWGHGAEVNHAGNGGKTPLTCAVGSGHEATTFFLLERGAEVNQSETDGWTPLLYAVRRGHESITRQLLAHGADSSQNERNGWTPLLYAASKGSIPIIRLLVEHGASIDRAKKDGITPLMIAAYRELPEVIFILLEHGANIELSSNDGRTALLHAAANGSVAGVVTLLEHGADFTKVDYKGQSALSIALDRRYLEIVKLLAEAAARGHQIATQ